MAPLALGTETDDSIITPAALNGVIGVRPEHGLLPIDGVVPVAPWQDVVGVFASRVAHATLLLAALCGEPSMIGAAVPANLKTVRVGACWSKGFPTVALSQAAAALRSDGAEVVEIDVSTSEQLAEDALVAALGEFARSLPLYLAGREGAPADFASLIVANRNDPVELGPFGQEIFEFAAGMDSDELAFAAMAAERARRVARAHLDTALAENGLDALITPANAPARLLTANGRDAGEASVSTLPALAGYPNIALPIAAAEGLPVGICVFGPPKLAALLPVAASIERACPAFRIADSGYGGRLA